MPVSGRGEDRQELRAAALREARRIACCKWQCAGSAADASYLHAVCCSCVQVYHSTMLEQKVASACGSALLPLKTKVKGPAPPAKPSQTHTRKQHRDSNVHREASTVYKCAHASSF